MEHKTITKDVGKTVDVVDPDVEKAAKKIVDYIITNYGDLLKRLAKE